MGLDFRMQVPGWSSSFISKEALVQREHLHASHETRLRPLCGPHRWNVLVGLRRESQMAREKVWATPQPVSTSTAGRIRGICGGTFSRKTFGIGVVGIS